MPTTKPRHTITESPALTRALDEAQRRFPEEGGSRSRLLMRLVEEGHRALVEAREAESEARRQSVARTRGALSGSYPTEYLESLRRDWPA